jgi:hydroxyacylglutathione hydrolase
MKRVNSAGPKLLGGVPGGEALPPQDFAALLKKEDAVVIDLRRPEAFGGAHIPGALSIGAGTTFAMWAAWVVPYGRPLLLVGDDSTYEEAARRALIRVGLDDIRGTLRGGMRAWIEAGLEQAHLPQVSVSELRERMARNGAFVLDVRTDAEWRSGHIEAAQHIMAGYLAERMSSVPKDKPVHIVCGSGYRSSIAASLLRRAGFRDVTNVAGGMSAWKQQNFPTVT